MTTSSGPRKGSRLGFFVPGLILAALAVFLVPSSVRDTATLIKRGAFVRDQFEIAHVTSSRMHTPQSFGGMVVSTGERFLGLDVFIVGADVLSALDRAGTLAGHRVPIYYLPATGWWAAVDRVFRFRVESIDQ